MGSTTSSRTHSVRQVHVVRRLLTNASMSRLHSPAEVAGTSKLLSAQLHARVCGLSFLCFVVCSQIKLLFCVSNLKLRTVE